MSDKIKLKKIMDKQKLDSPDPVIEVYKKEIDRTLLRENLKLTVQERFENLMALQRFADELQRAGRKMRQQRW